MQKVRSSFLSRLFSLCTGLIFLNMSFILVEVSALKLDKNKELIENIAKLIAGSSAEEETDGFEGLSDEDTKVKEIDLMVHYLSSAALSELYDTNEKVRSQNQGVPRFGNYEIFSPPPEA